MGDGVGIPSFREHGDGNHTADMRTEKTFLANGVDYLPQNIAVGDLFNRFVGMGQAVFPFERRNLRGKYLFEIVAHLVAIFKCIAVY